MYLSKVRIENFKSIRDQEFDLHKINVLIGRNASGKTNILEFFKLIKLALTSDSIPFNPFTPWWGFENVVWNKDNTLTIRGEFHFEDVDVQRGKSGIDLFYIIALGYVDGIAQITHEEISIPDKVRIVKIGNRIEYRYSKNYIEMSLMEFIDEVREEIEFERKNILKILEEKEKHSRIEVLRDEALRNEALLKKLEKLLTESRWSEKIMDGFGIRETFNSQSLLTHFIDLRDPLPDELRRYRRERGNHENSFSILRFFSDITFLRPPDLRKIREAVFVSDTRELKEDGSNLIHILYNLQFKKRGQAVREIIAQFYPESSIGFTFTQDNRLMLVVNENDLELHPHGISDGFYKLLFILTGLYGTSSMLLVDEIENSLHLSAIEFALDIIKSEDVQTIICTHSPLIIDLLDLQDILVCIKDRGETMIKRPNDIENLKKELNELNLSHSDAWAIGRLEE